MRQQPSMLTTALAVSHLSMRYPNSSDWIFTDLHFSVGRGEFVVVIGPSGSGKSTLLRLVAGFEQPASGEIYIGGRKAAEANSRVFLPPEKRDIGFVFQSYALWPHMDVETNISFPLEQMSVTRAERVTLMEEVLTRLGLKNLRHRFPAQLSGGQRQRVALARALVNRPTLLLMDEPLSSLDASLRKGIQDEFITMRDEWHPSVLYVTHDQEEAIKLADRIIVLHKGKIQQQGTPYDIYFSPKNSFVAAFFGEANLVDGVILENAGDGKYYVAVNGGKPFVARSMAVKNPADKVTVMIRPAWIELLDEHTQVGYQEQIQIINSKFMGDNIHYSIDWHGVCMTVCQAADQHSALGKKAGFQIKDAWIFEKTGVKSE